MKLLSTETIKNFESLGWAERSISQLHNQFSRAVKKRCSDGCAEIFAAPEPSGSGKIDYYTEPFEKASRYASLSKGAREQIDTQIHDAVAEIEQLRQSLAASDRDNDKNLATVLDLVLKLPNSNHIWSVDGKPVVTMWGYAQNGSSLDLRSINTPEEKPTPVIQPRGKKWPLLLSLLIALLLIGFFAWPSVSCKMGWRACHAPIASADDGVLQIGVPYINLDIVQNDIEPDGDVINVASCEAPGKVLDSRRIQFTRDPSSTAESVSFSCTITDPEGNLDSALVTIQIPAPINRPPQAHPDRLSLPLGSTTVSHPILGNDTDEDMPSVSIQACTSPSVGQVTIAGKSISFAYTRDNRTNLLSVSFTCTIQDADGLTDSATVTVDIPPKINGAPSGGPINVTLGSEDSAIDIDILSEVTDPEGDNMRVIGCSLPGLIYGRGARYERNNTTSGVESFTCEVEDTRGATGTVTVNVTVVPPVINQPPAGGPINRTLELGEPFVDIDILSEVTDPDGDSVRVIGCNSPGIQYGSGARYERTSTSSGIESFTCDLEDTSGTLGTITVNVAIAEEITRCTPISTELPVRIIIGMDVSSSMDDFRSQGLAAVSRILDEAPQSVDVTFTSMETTIGDYITFAKTGRQDISDLLDSATFINHYPAPNDHFQLYADWLMNELKATNGQYENTLVVTISDAPAEFPDQENGLIQVFEQYQKPIEHIVIKLGTDADSEESFAAISWPSDGSRYYAIETADLRRLTSSILQAARIEKRTGCN